MKKRKKGIAVPYIIAIVLGVAVLALLGYWFYITSGTFSRETCLQNYRDWCQVKSRLGYPTDTTTKTQWEEDKPQCKTYGFAGTKADCQATLGEV